LNLGLRYELITPFTDSNDLMVNFDPNFVDSTGKKGRFIVPSDKTLPFLDSRIITMGVVTAGNLVWASARLGKKDKNNFAPRSAQPFVSTDKSVFAWIWILLPHFGGSRHP